MFACLSHNKNITMTTLMMTRWWWWRIVRIFFLLCELICKKAQKISLTSTWVNEDFALKCKLVLKINECLFSCSLCCSRKLKWKRLSFLHLPPLCPSLSMLTNCADDIYNSNSKDLTNYMLFCYIQTYMCNACAIMSTVNGIKFIWKWEIER